MNRQRVTSKTEERLMLIRRILEQSGAELTKEKTKTLKKIEVKIKELRDEQFAELIKEINPSPSIFFYGRHYVLTDGVLNFTDSSELVRRRVREALKRWQDRAYYILFAVSKMRDPFTERQLAERMKKLDFPYLQHSLLGWLESLRLLIRTPEGKWKAPEEILPAMKKELADYQPKLKLRSALAKRELEEVMRMEKEFEDFLKLLIEERLDRTVSFGEEFSVSKLVEYLRSLFGPVLYYDILLTMTQQYSIADVSVVTEEGGARMRTGFNLALFGEPGTGKTFSTYTMIMGDLNKGIPAHGLPGRNRYCGGMTPAKFIRIGEAYEGRKYNFIITEFNDWFKYCLPYEAEVKTAQGESVQIGEIVREKARLNVLSLNKNFFLEARKICGFFRRKAPRLIEFETQTGKVLRVTPKHPLPTLADGLIWRKAESFSVDDYFIILDDNHLKMERIERKVVINESEEVFDIAVPLNHNFFANGFLVHNSGLVEPLKIAMEHGIIKWETARQTIGPYRFTSFLSVNYNTRVFERGYEVTVRDPNFSAIEERMLCRLHRLTKERYREIAEKQMELVLGKLKMEKAGEIRDHITLVHAIETEHPLVKEMFKYKPVLLTERVFNEITMAREAILDTIAQERLDFSPRLERRAIQLMCAMSVMSYFKEQDERIRVDSEAMKLGIRFYVEEAAVRSKEKFNPEDVLENLGLS